MNNGYALTSNGKVSMGYPVADFPPCRLHALNFLAAVKQCGNQDVSLTLTENHLIIKAPKFTVSLERIDDMPTIEPDKPLVPLGQAFIDTLKLVAPFSVEEAKKVVLASLLVKDGCVSSSDSIVVTQAHHGFNLPEMVLPKSFVAALINLDKEVTQFGYSGTSCTIWFADGSWVKTQLYAESWPDIDTILNKKCNPQPLNEDFHKALVAIQPFSKSGNVYFEDGCLRSHRDLSEGASHEVVGIQKGPCFNIKELRKVESFIDIIDFYSHNAAFFFSKDRKTRGAIMGVRG